MAESLLSSSSSMHPVEHRRPSNQRTQIADHDSRFSCNICLESVDEPVLTLCGHLYCWPCLYRWLEPCNIRGSNTPSFSSLNHDDPMLAPSTPNGEMDSRPKTTCPVCKSACSVSTVIPIYVRGDDPRQTTKKITTEKERERKKEKNNMKGNLREEEQQSLDDELDTSISATTTGLRQRRWGEGIPSRPSSSLVSPTSTPVRTLPTPTQSSPMGGFTMTLQQALLGSSLPMSHSQLSRHPSDDDLQDPASEFLSRVLLMLGSFVILCLLMF